MIDEKIIDKVNNYFGTKLPEACLSYLIANIQIKKLNPGRVLFSEGTIDNNTYCIWNGFMKGFFEKEQNIVITNLLRPGDIITNLSTQSTDFMAPKTVEAISSVELLYISKDILMSLIKQYPDFGQMYLGMIKTIVQQADVRLRFLHIYTGAERYDLFHEIHPEFLEIIPQYEIASYLNISPETLSRLKKERIK